MTQQAVRDEPVAYIQYTKDPEPGIDMGIQCYLRSPGMPVPDGCTPLYLHRAQHVAHDAAVVELIEAVEALMEWVEPVAGDNSDEAAAADEIASFNRLRSALRAHKESP